MRGTPCTRNANYFDYISYTLVYDKMRKIGPNGTYYIIYTTTCIEWELQTQRTVGRNPDARTFFDLAGDGLFTLRG